MVEAGDATQNVAERAALVGHFVFATMNLMCGFHLPLGWSVTKHLGAVRDKFGPLFGVFESS